MPSRRRTQSSHRQPLAGTGLLDIYVQGQLDLELLQRLWANLVKAVEELKRFPARSHVSLSLRPEHRRPRYTFLHNVVELTLLREALKVIDNVLQRDDSSFYRKMRDDLSETINRYSFFQEPGALIRGLAAARNMMHYIECFHNPAGLTDEAAELRKMAARLKTVQFMRNELKRFAQNKEYAACFAPALPALPKADKIQNNPELVKRLWADIELAFDAIEPLFRAHSKRSPEKEREVTKLASQMDESVARHQQPVSAEEKLLIEQGSTATRRGEMKKRAHLATAAFMQANIKRSSALTEAGEDAGTAEIPALTIPPSGATHAELDNFEITLRLYESESRNALKDSEELRRELIAEGKRREQSLAAKRTHAEKEAARKKVADEARAKVAATPRVEQMSQGEKALWARTAFANVNPEFSATKPVTLVEGMEFVDGSLEPMVSKATPRVVQKVTVSFPRLGITKMDFDIPVEALATPVHAAKAPTAEAKPSADAPLAQAS